MSAAGAGERWALIASFAWGLAEAMVFFIVPDVLLMWIASRSPRTAIRACAAAIAGALVGGTIMYAVGARSPEYAERLLDRVPAIERAMIDDVRTDTANHGLAALLLGPAQGRPYKIYAVEWGARRGNVPLFLLVSVPARGVRFLLCMALSRFAFGALARWTHRRAIVELAILLAGWTAFYAIYFAHFGW